jgi:hypothetical protein
MFFDIADDVHEAKEVDQLLRLTDNLPLAVNLIAHLVDDNSCSMVLSRWETEKTSLLSEGHDKRSNLDASIAISLSSPRLNSSPGAKDLLGLLSILPDGLSETELIQSKLPIKDILACKSVLLQTSLAYSDDRQRLKSLVPIREHMQHFHPASPLLIQAIQKYFHMLLDLYNKYCGTHQTASMINPIASNLGNLTQILRQGLLLQHPNLTDIITCTISLNAFSRFTGHGWIVLMEQLPDFLPLLCDHRLKALFITEVFLSADYKAIDDPELLISQAQSHLSTFHDPYLECKLINTLLVLLYSNILYSSVLFCIGKLLYIPCKQQIQRHNMSRECPFIRNISWRHHLPSFGVVHACTYQMEDW